MDVKKTLQNMTLEEKVLLLQAKDNWHLNAVERLGIPSVMLTDGPAGVRIMADEGQPEIRSTTIPAEGILASSWDESLIEELGKVLGDESREMGVKILLGPGVNAKRSPLGGRNFEYYSEDPYLSGKLAAAMIRGVQSRHVGTSLKHYVANDQETRRFTMNAQMDDRTLREICLKPFEIAIREGNPWTIMGAYPKVRGTFACENPYLLETILRDEYGYEGVVLSDWGAVRNKVSSHINGLDLETGTFSSYDEMLDAVKKGVISEETLNTHVERVLTLLSKVLEESETASVPVDFGKQHHAAVRAAEESLVLLKNEGALLPLRRDARVLAVGALGETPHISGGGSSGTVPRYMLTPVEALQSFASVTFCPGYTGSEPEEDQLSAACMAAQDQDVLIVFIGTLPTEDSEGSDRKSISLSEAQTELVRRLSHTRKPLVLVNESGSAMDLSEVSSLAAAVIHCGLAGEGFGEALANILFGVTNPSGKLAETFPLCLENTPAYPFYPGTGNDVSYVEGIFVGYRYYDTKKIPVLYPFGHGLSYTSFAYSDLRLSADHIDKDDVLTVRFCLKNTGTRRGKEVVQLYVTDKKSHLIRPVKELKGFQKITLEPGEEREVSFTLDAEAFSYYSPELGRFGVEEGWFSLSIAASSRDIRLTEDVYVQSDDEFRAPLTGYNTIGEFYEDNRYSPRVKEVFGQLGITEDHSLFPIITGILMKDLPAFMDFLYLPREQSVQMQQYIIGSSSV